MSDARETYLDQLFDRLAGTGPAGRRIFAEAEAHLEEAVQAGLATGQSPEAAANAAVARFGGADAVVAAHLRAGALPWRGVAQRLFAAGWFLSGIGFTVIGLSGLFTLAIAKLFGAQWVAFDRADSVYPSLRCAELLQAYPRAGGCWSASVEHHAQELVFGPLMLGGIGLVLLLAFWLARRSPLAGLTRLPPASLVATAGFTAFLLAGKALALFGLLGLLEGTSAGVGTDFARAAAALLVSLAFLPSVLSELRLRRA